MAEGIKNVCTHCSKTIEAWSDGNPYYLLSDGSKKYAYHPSEDFERCIGNDSPHLCLRWAHEFMVDSRAPISNCPKCQTGLITDTFHLHGRRCPFCKKGSFFRKLFAVS